jgi:hypothetical protein
MVFISERDMSKATNHLTQKAKPTQDGTSVARGVLWYPTQAKTGLEWGTQPSLPVKQRIKHVRSRPLVAMPPV